FDLEHFLRYAQDELARAFDLHLAADVFHLENVAQVLKDEPRSLFCFLNVQRVPIEDLRRLRGFSQELHQTLLLCEGPRDLAAEESRRDELMEAGATSSGAAYLVQETASAEHLRLLLEIGTNLSRTLEPDVLLPKIAESLL